MAVMRVQWDKLGVNRRLIRRLVRAGADVNQQNIRLRTALFFLVPKPDAIELADYFVNHFQADVNLCDADGFTVVHIAAILGKMDYVALFLPHMRSNVRTANDETVRSCLEWFCDPSAVTEEVEALLASMESRGHQTITAERVYAEPRTVWNHFLLHDRFRDLFSLYIVDAFHRFRGGNPLTIERRLTVIRFGFAGQSLFIDLFHHINYSAICKRRAREFLRDVADWRGSSSKTLLDLIDQHSVVMEPEGQEDEPSQIFRHVSRMVKDLMNEVLLKDAREPEESRHGWQLDVLPVGSVADGSKILLPDVFDFLVVFRRFRQGNKPVIGQDFTLQVERFRVA